VNLEPIYMIRDASFGQDFTPKLLAALIAIGLVAWDWRKQRRRDYLWVFVVGTVIWAAAEAFLSIQGIRDMPERTLLGRPLSLPVSYLIQGMGEGAFVAVLGLFVGDRVLNPSTRRRGFIIGLVGLVLLALVTFRSRRFLMPDLEASRRDMLSTQSLLALLVLCIIGIVFYVARREWRPRTMMMFTYMLVFGTVFTLTQVAIGGRWIEVDAAGGGYERAGLMLTIFGLAFDVVFEIALAYVPFLAIPVFLGLIRDPTPLPSGAVSAEPEAATSSTGTPAGPDG